MSLDWTPFVDLVRRHGRFLITTHVRPDGDGLGSMLALSDALERQGKEVQLVIASPMPARYQFVDRDKKIQCVASPTEPMNQAQVAIVLDTGTWNQLDRIGPFVREFAGPKVVIDHHLTQDDLGAVRFVDTSAEATGRLVFEAIAALGQPLSERAANDLFVALAMDTGWFRHSNTGPATLTLAADLMRQGARPEILYQQLFEQNTLPRLKLTGLVLDRLQLIGHNQVAYTEIRRADYPATGALPSDSEDLVNYTLSVAGVEVGLLFMEQPRGGVKVSFRSRSRVDVARVAERFGGGGHRLASGAVLDTDLADAKTGVLEAVLAALTPAG
jgi:phosphoesterase RecJ-like protein